MVKVTSTSTLIAKLDSITEQRRMKMCQIYDSQNKMNTLLRTIIDGLLHFSDKTMDKDL